MLVAIRRRRSFYMVLANPIARRLDGVMMSQGGGGKSAVSPSAAIMACFNPLLLAAFLARGCSTRMQDDGRGGEAFRADNTTNEGRVFFVASNPEATLATHSAVGLQKCNATQLPQRRKKKIYFVAGFDMLCFIQYDVSVGAPSNGCTASECHCRFQCLTLKYPRRRSHFGPYV